MNTIKDIVEEAPVKAAKPADEDKSVKAARRIIKSINIFSFMERDKIISIMPFVFFITLLALIYIANSYYAEKTIREIDATGKELKELRSEFISVQSDLMIKSKQTEVLNAVQSLGLKESVEPPKKIVVRNKKNPEDKSVAVK
jgi:hypothetical protein